MELRALDLKFSRVKRELGIGVTGNGSYKGRDGSEYSLH